MPRAESQAMSTPEFLTLASNLLHRTLVEAGRTGAKQAYRRMAEGERLPLATVRMEDETSAAFFLSLEHSEFRGRLTYGSFSASVKTLLNNVVQAVQEENEVPVFADQSGGASMIFGVPAVTAEAGTTNVMMLCADPAAPGGTELRLMYLDPMQFAGQLTAGEDAADTRV